MLVMICTPDGFTHPPFPGFVFHDMQKFAVLYFNLKSR